MPTSPKSPKSPNSSCSTPTVSRPGTLPAIGEHNISDHVSYETLVEASRKSMSHRSEKLKESSLGKADVSKGGAEDGFG